MGDYRNEYPGELLPAGTAAPPFALQRAPNETTSLEDFRGTRLIMAFYPADWSPVCGDQMALYNQVLPLFNELGADLVGISVDGAWCHKAYREQRNLHFALLADFEPKGDVSKRYGAYAHGLGVAQRALFVLDEEGAIRWSSLSPMDVNPGADGILSALESMGAPVAA